MAVTTVGTIQLIATIDTSQYKRGAKEIDKTNKDIETSTDESTKKSEKGFLRMGAAIGVVAGLASSLVSKGINAISRSLDNAISRVDTFNNFPRVMENLGFESEEATKQIERLDKATRGLPTPLDRVVSAMQQIAPASKSLDDATDVTLALNNALLASGKSADEQANAFNQFVQALGRGRPDLIELRSFAATAPGQFRQIALSLGLTATTADGVNDAFKDGVITMDDFTGALVKLNKDGLKAGGKEFASFEKQARDATGGIGTAISRVQSAISRNIANIIKALGDTRITNAFDRMRTGVDSLGNAIVTGLPTAINIAGEIFNVLSKIVRVVHDLRVPIISLASAFAAYRAVLITTNAVHAVHATYLALVGTRYVMLNGQLIALKGATLAQVAAQTALNVVMNLNPMALVVGTAAALASVFLLTRNRTDELKAAQDRLKTATDAVKDAQDRLRGANISAEGAALRVERAQKSYNEAVKQYGKDSLEAREAEYNLKRARDEQEQAIKNVIQAQNDLKKSSEELDAAQRKVQEESKKTTSSYKLQRDELKKLQDETAKGLVGGGLKDGSFDLKNFGGFRANGGDVTTRNAYVVGENGPELFVPDTNGEILNDRQINSRSSNNSTQPAVIKIPEQSSAEYRQGAINTIKAYNEYLRSKEPTSDWSCLMITMTLTDDVETVTLQPLNVPLTEATINNDVEVVTLDNNISVYIVPDSDKRIWTHTWGFLDEDDYNVLKGFRDRQRTLFKFPRVTISELGVTDVPVYMKLDPKNIIDHCGTVQNASIWLRESVQMPDIGS